MTFRVALLAGILLMFSCAPAPAQTISSASVLRVTKREPIGTFDGVAFDRITGTVSGIIAPGDLVVGLGSNPFAWTAGYELIAPHQLRTDETVVVEPENRGRGLVLGRLNSADPDFLFKHRISYARIQWQYGFAIGVPKDAQGVGEAIVRDFGSALAAQFRTRLLVGISQSGWFIETFVAEGFNENRGNHEGVYAGAIAVDGTGNWLAINQLAKSNHTPQQPYLDPKNPRVLAAAELLHRPSTDPFFIDIANYTDFYRAHASLTDTAALPQRMRRYDWPSPHATGSRAAMAAFTTMKCNGGKPVWLNPIAYDPYLRALVLELAHEVGSVSVPQAPPLPPTTLFKLGPAPAETTNFNPLAGAKLEVPLVDADAQPEGGVRFPEVEAPIGKPEPVSLPPVITTTIDNTCGNFGEWQAFWGSELERRYGSSQSYVQRYSAALDKLITGGYVLAEDRVPMLARAAALYANPGGY